MAAKAWAPQQQDEIVLRNDAVSLRMLLNRRARTMRVVDFRAGPSRAKRDAVLKLAEQEGIDKIYTLVERDEIATWVKMGFLREASVPGFYKRTDAFLLGFSMRTLDPRHSQVRLAARRAQQALEASGDIGDEEVIVEEDPVIVRAEKTLVTAKKYSKQLGSRSLPAMKISSLDATAMKKLIANATRSGRALSGFEPFGRDAIRQYFVSSTKGVGDIGLSLEEQPCFQCVLFELLISPKNEQEWMATAATTSTVCDRLTERGYVAAFAMSPTDDPWLASAYVYAGFRRTGVLRDHMLVGGERKDSYAWSRKLANPADE